MRSNMTYSYPSNDTRWFTHSGVYPFCSLCFIPDELDMLEQNLSPKFFTHYLPSDTHKLLGYKIGTPLIIYVSTKPNKIRTSTLSHLKKGDYLSFCNYNPFNLYYTEDPLQYETLYKYTIKVDNKLTEYNLPYHDIIAYSYKPKRTNHKFTYQIYRLTENDQPSLVKDLICDEDWI